MLLNQQEVGGMDDGMIKDMKSRTIVGNCRSEKFFGVDVHRGSVLTPLLLIVMQEALITEFRIDCTKWLLYKYDPVIKAESMEELLVKWMHGSIGRRRLFI